MSRLTLWVIPTSPPSWAVRMLAQILGVELELKNMDFNAKEHKSPSHVKINPMGTIPVLQDGDFSIAESHTIMKYLLQKYGNAEQLERLYPSDLRARALVDQSMFFDTGVAFIRIKMVSLPSRWEGLEGVTPALAEKLEESYGITELYLTRTKYAAGESVTLADLSLGATTIALNQLHKIDPARFPRVVAWLNKLQEETYFKNIAVPGSELFGSTVHGLWERNKKK